MKKDTVKLTEELALCADFRTFYNENRTSLISEPLSKLLARLLDKKGLTRYRAIRRSTRRRALFRGWRSAWYICPC